MPKEDHRNGSHLLAALPEAEWAHLGPHLVPVDMQLGQVVYEPGDRLVDVYFPSTAIVSLLYAMEDGASAEIANAGNEGVIGVELFMEGETMPNRAIVQSAGRACRLDAHILKEEFQHAGPVQRLLLRYTQALITQVAQTAVCNRHHSIVPMATSQPSSSAIERTEYDSGTDCQHAGCPPGWRKKAAIKLQDASLIRYSYGHIEVLDRPGPEKRACECYRVVKRESDRLLSDLKST